MLVDDGEVWVVMGSRYNGGTRQSAATHFWTGKAMPCVYRARRIKRKNSKSITRPASAINGAMTYHLRASTNGP
jgi:hypothetical protein